MGNDTLTLDKVVSRLMTLKKEVSNCMPYDQLHSPN